MNVDTICSNVCSLSALTDSLAPLECHPLYHCCSVHCHLCRSLVCVCVCAAPKFMEALKDEGMVDEESLSEAHLSTAYSKLQEQVADNIARQNQIMPRVEVRGGWGVGRKWVGEMKGG